MLSMHKGKQTMRKKKKFKTCDFEEERSAGCVGQGFELTSSGAKV